LDDGLMRKLLEISPEEQAYRNGTDAVKRDIYTVKDAFEVTAVLSIFPPTGIITSKSCMSAREPLPIT